MDSQVCDVAVIGAGTAGIEAWRAATQAGADALLIERGPGGTTCARVGCMPSKALLAAGRAAHAARGAGDFGVRVGSVEVDGAAVMARVRRMRDLFVESVFDNMDDIPKDKRIDGAARFTGPTTLAVDDRLTIEAKSVVIATGADPEVPDAFRDVRDRVRTHVDVWDIDTLPDRLAVLGAGPVGIELAQAFAWLGVEVTVFDPGEAIGALTDPEANKAAIACLQGEVTLRLGCKPHGTAIDGGVRLEGDGPPVDVDLVLAAAGRPPNLDALDLEAAGLTPGEHGVPEFDHRTKRVGDTSVWIAGDANDWRPVLHEAAHAGRIAGRGAAGRSAKDDPALLTNLAMVYTEPGIVTVGTGFCDLPEGARIGSARMIGGRAEIDGHQGGLVRVYADADCTLIGGTIVAHASEHLGHELMIAVARGMTAEAFMALPWYHPCYEEVLRDAVRDLMG